VKHGKKKKGNGAVAPVVRALTKRIKTIKGCGAQTRRHRKELKSATFNKQKGPNHAKGKAQKKKKNNPTAREQNCKKEPSKTNVKKFNEKYPIPKTPRERLKREQHECTAKKRRE